MKIDRANGMTGKSVIERVKNGMALFLGWLVDRWQLGAKQTGNAALPVSLLRLSGLSGIRAGSAQKTTHAALPGVSGNDDLQNILLPVVTFQENWLCAHLKIFSNPILT